jgi:hypothetical protein
MTAATMVLWTFAVGVLRPVGKVTVSAIMSLVTEDSHSLRMMCSHFRHNQ